MSVINQMLKDIEKRDHTKKHIPLQGLSYVTYDERKQITWKILLTSAMVSFVVLFGLHKAYYQPHKKQVFLLTSANSLKIEPAITSKLDTRAILPGLSSVLTGITLQIQQNTTYLSLMLTQDSFYRINLDKNNEQLTLYLDHAHTLTGLPPINYANSAIKAMNVANLPNGDLKIAIQLQPGTQLKHLDMVQSGKLPELQIELFYQENSSNELKQEPQLSYYQAAKPLKKLVINMEIQEQFQQALTYSAAGNDTKAVQQLTQLLNNYPDYYLAREALIKILLIHAQHARAEREIKIGLQFKPNYLPFIEMNAHILADQGKISQALRLLQQYSPSLTENPDYHAFIAALYQQQGSFAMSAKLYEQLLRVNPGKAVWWVGLGVSMEGLDKHSEASWAYNKAKNCDELSPELSAYIASRLQVA